MKIWHTRPPTALQPWEQIMAIMAQLACRSSTIPTLWRTSRIERKSIFSYYSNVDLFSNYCFYFSLHTGTVAGKLLTKKFCNKAPAYSYYIGCSLGGRMGVKAAEAFPDDYDGIVAGCPAVDFLHLQGERAMFYPITGPVGSPNFIRPELWTGLIHDEVLKQCDLLDGVKDGIIEVPDRCHFRPETLKCPSSWYSFGYKKECLNPQQIQQLKKIYAPYTYPDGTLIFPRMNPGNEEQAVKKFFAGAPFSYSQVSCTPYPSTTST